MSYARRLANFKRHPTPELSLEELKESRLHIWRLVQQEQFSDELKELRDGRVCPQESALSQLAPFLDDTGIMRARGRLRKAACALDYDTKHPILLHRRHHVVQLFLRHKHNEKFHAGIEFLKAEIQLTC